MASASHEPPSATWIAVVTPQPVVQHGIVSMLEGRHGDLLITTQGPDGGEPDLVFFDVIHLHEGDEGGLDHWVRDTASLVIAVTRELRPDLGALALDLGAEAAISIGASLDDYLEVIEAALTGQLHESPAAQDAEDGTRLGREVGLTEREADVLGLIVRGVSNHEIADELHLSINSVKSYIRSAYRKMEVTSRAQAVGWGVQHGFALDDDGPTDSSAGPEESPGPPPVTITETLASRARRRLPEVDSPPVVEGRPA